LKYYSLINNNIYELQTLRIQKYKYFTRKVNHYFIKGIIFNNFDLLQFYLNIRFKDDFNNNKKVFYDGGAPKTIGS